MQSILDYKKHDKIVGRKKLVISFSGGLTSAYMTKLLLAKLDPVEWEIVVVFANTGREMEETFDFIRKCDKYLFFNTVWVEAVINPKRGKGTRHKVIDIHTASRDGEPFLALVEKYGLPNIVCKNCTRELKIKAIESYAKYELGWKHFYTAIGIRADEKRRIPKKYKESYLIYPLALDYITVRPQINWFWYYFPFTLECESWETNCVGCIEKSVCKLKSMCVKHPKRMDFWRKLGREKMFFIPEGRKSRSNSKHTKPPYYLYRYNMDMDQIFEETKEPFEMAIDESQILY